MTSRDARIWGNLSTLESEGHKIKFLIQKTSRIVAVHGLNGHREKSWTYTDERTGKDILWLRESLPACIPNARISTFGYRLDGSSATEVREKAIQLLDALCELPMADGGEV